MKKIDLFLRTPMNNLLSPFLPVITAPNSWAKCWIVLIWSLSIVIFALTKRISFNAIIECTPSFLEILIKKRLSKKMSKRNLAGVHWEFFFLLVAQLVLWQTYVTYVQIFIHTALYVTVVVIYYYNNDNEWWWW